MFELTVQTDYCVVEAELLLTATKEWVGCEVPPMVVNCMLMTSPDAN